MRVILCEEDWEARLELRKQMLLVMEELNFNCTVTTCGRDELLETADIESCSLLIMSVRDGREPEIVRQLHRRNAELLVIWALSSARDVPVMEEEYVIGSFVRPLDRIRLSKLVSRFLYEKAKGLDEEFYYVKNSVGTVQMKLKYDRIEYAESQGNQILLHLTNGQIIRIYERMKNLEQELADRRFLKCHQSYIVNMDHVRAVEDAFVMKSEARVQIRQREKKRIRELYFRFMTEER